MLAREVVRRSGRSIVRSPSSSNACQTGIRPMQRPCILVDAYSTHARPKPATAPSLLPWWNCPWRRSLPVHLALPGHRTRHDPWHRDEPYRLNAAAPIAASGGSWPFPLRPPGWPSEATSLHKKSNAVSRVTCLMNCARRPHDSLPSASPDRGEDTAPAGTLRFAQQRPPGPPAVPSRGADAPPSACRGGRKREDARRSGLSGASADCDPSGGQALLCLSCARLEWREQSWPGRRLPSSERARSAAMPARIWCRPERT